MNRYTELSFLNGNISVELRGLKKNERTVSYHLMTYLLSLLPALHYLLPDLFFFALACYHFSEGRLIILFGLGFVAMFVFIVAGKLVSEIKLGV